MTHPQVKKKLEASFPEVPDVSKVQGFDSIVPRAQEVYDQTFPTYQHFVDAVEYIAQVVPACTCGLAHEAHMKHGRRT
jgi:hypothetical protein